MYSILNKLTEYIYFYISKILLHTLLLLIFKIVESLQCILKAMFPDSNITQKIAIGSTKLYQITHGLVPYYHEGLLKSVKSKFVICFDEAYN